ncbi:hypothetical protein B0H17DRAFT_1216880 [Mycena rosella]|uniref:Uncharacterized protein n=1 Tax=Mycena rosella TaxID=1033263 RepID=A0AAD7C4X8_MYCRO|nr:hypothetical protein B0H17DRAFT_1216880 [Mycena rosella]
MPSRVVEIAPWLDRSEPQEPPFPPPRAGAPSTSRPRAPFVAGKLRGPVLAGVFSRGNLSIAETTNSAIASTSTSAIREPCDRDPSFSSSPAPSYARQVIDVRLYPQEASCPDSPFLPVPNPALQAATKGSQQDDVPPLPRRRASASIIFVSTISLICIALIDIWRAETAEDAENLKYEQIAVSFVSRTFVVPSSVPDPPMPDTHVSLSSPDAITRRILYKALHPS